MKYNAAPGVHEISTTTFRSFFLCSKFTGSFDGVYMYNAGWGVLIAGRHRDRWKLSPFSPYIHSLGGLLPLPPKFPLGQRTRARPHRLQNVQHETPRGHVIRHERFRSVSHLCQGREGVEGRSVPPAEFPIDDPAELQPR